MNNRIAYFSISVIMALFTSVISASDISDLKLEVDKLKANLEGNSKSGYQLAGYAAFDYSSTENGESSFSGVKFAPIFHAKYGNIFQFEGELEITTTSTGETEIELEYAAGTIFLNDYMGLQVGKFMSPVGQFVQNQHPSWINKLPETPLGFGHDGAAPTSVVGLALRGGLPKMGKLRSNYAIYIANAPSFGTAADGDVVIDAVGKTSSGDVNPNIGGRYALNPVGGMEIGISGAFGEVSEENNITASSLARDYSVVGVDFMYSINSFDFKGEYIRQTIGENDQSILEGGVWEAVYAQVSYQFVSLAIEPVLRYSKYNNPEQKRSQAAVGLNYLFSNNLIAKLAYEFNQDNGSLEDEAVSSNNNNKILMQLAFGF